MLHHNTDKTQIVAGRSHPAFGGGEVICPLYILLTGRATRVFKEEEIPVDTIAIKAARKLLAESLSSLDVNNHVILDAKIGMGSSDLRDVFGRKIPSANDTSFGVGYAPLSETEKIVYNTERELMRLKKSIPAIGEDIKVMGMRQGDTINLTIACAMIDRYVSNLKGYSDTKNDIVEHVVQYAKQFTARKVNAQMNVADNLEQGSVYITVTGTSAEMGDDGAVGRAGRRDRLPRHEHEGRQLAGSGVEARPRSHREQRREARQENGWSCLHARGFCCEEFAAGGAPAAGGFTSRSRSRDTLFYTGP